MMSLSTLLKDCLSPRLLKKVKMQGTARSEARGVLTGTSQRHGSAATQQIGLFQQPVRPSRLGAKGVTLLELTVTLTILALVGGIAVQAVRLGSRSWAKGEQRAEAEQRTRILAGILGQELASALPVMAKVDEKMIVAFRGESDRIFFHSVPTGQGPLPFSAMVRSLAYSVQPGQGLVVQESYPLVEGEVSLDPRGAPRVADPDVTGVRFRYLAPAPSADDSPHWTDTWDPGAKQEETAEETAETVTVRRGGRTRSVPRRPADTAPALPLAVEVAVARMERGGERTFSFVVPIRLGQRLTLTAER